MNTVNKKRIIWMLDETIANTHPRNWQKVRKLEEKLVDTIGNSSCNHEIIDPITCLQQLATQLKKKDFSCIVDLTGWLTPAMHELFPHVPVENRLTLSRVRVVTSPKLETTGYRVSMFPDELRQMKSELDLTHPLIVDDVSFSGWTSLKVMNILGTKPEHTTHAFLIANTGTLGKDEGAVSLLQSQGSKVLFGHKITTPQDDGWHLKDLHQNPNIGQSLVLALLFQEAVRKDGIESVFAQKFFTHDIVINTLFPDHFTSSQIRELVQEGRFILRKDNAEPNDEIHARNPLLWASPYFQEHVDIHKILFNKDLVLSLLGELQLLTSDPEGRREASVELQREITNSHIHTIEREAMRGKERA